MLLFPLIRVLQAIYDYLMNLWVRSSKKTTCRLGAMGEIFKVPMNERANAFRTVRDILFETERRTRFEKEHSEIHVVGMVLFVALIGAGISAYKGDAVLRTQFLIAATISFAVVVIAEIRLSQREANYIRTLDTNEVKNLLSKVRHIPDSAT
jgi:hypothetical protein